MALAAVRKLEEVDDDGDPDLDVVTFVRIIQRNGAKPVIQSLGMAVEFDRHSSEPLFWFDDPTHDGLTEKTARGPAIVEASVLAAAGFAVSIKAAVQRCIVLQEAVKASITEGPVGDGYDFSSIDRSVVALKEMLLGGRPSVSCSVNPDGGGR
jgi:hypothetical protein